MQNKRSWYNSQWVGRSRNRAPNRTGPGSHPAFCTMCTGSLPWVKRPEGGADHPSLPSAKVKVRVLLYRILPIWAFMVCFNMKCTFTFTQKLCSENYGVLWSCVLIEEDNVMQYHMQQSIGKLAT
jgi:hypothetical protein